LLIVILLNLIFISSSYSLIAVHKKYSLTPKSNTSINVVANGARYRFIVNIGVVKVEDGFVYVTDGYKYEQGSIS